MRKVIDAGDDTLPPCRSFSQSHSHPFVPLIVFFLSYYLVYFSSCFFMMHHLALLVIILPSLPTLLPFISLFLYSNSGLVLFCCVQYRAFLWLRFALATSLHKRFFVVVVFKSQMKVMFDLMFTMCGRALLVARWQINMGCFAAMFQIHSSSVN